MKRCNLLSRVAKAIGKDKITKVKFKSSKKEFIKLRVNGKLKLKSPKKDFTRLRVNGKFYLAKSTFSFSIVDYMFYFIQNINVRNAFKLIKYGKITLRDELFGYGIKHFSKKNIFSSSLV